MVGGVRSSGQWLVKRRSARDGRKRTGGGGEGWKSGRKKPSFEEKTRFQLSEAGGISIAFTIRSVDRTLQNYSNIAEEIVWFPNLRGWSCLGA